MKRYLPLWLILGLLPLLNLLEGSTTFAQVAEKEPADFIVHNAKVLTIDAKFSLAEAVAVKGERIIAVGTNKDVLRHRGAKTREIDARGGTVMPGLYDSHTHPVGAATSELSEKLPNLESLSDVLAYIRKKTSETKKGEWIVLRFAFPTRLKEARFPTLKELDEAAPDHPVHYHAGPASMVNSAALRKSGITKDTKNPANGVIVKDPKTGEPTGMLRNAASVLKGMPGSKATTGDRKEALKTLFALYNSQGLTSIADRNGDRGALDLYLALHKAGELNLRINVARGFSPYGSREEVAKRLDELRGKDNLGGPTGTGGIWIRIGPIKFFLDGGMLNGTAFMRQPWPKGDTYQVVEDDYRGLLFVNPDQVKMLVEEATKRKWQVTAHTAGEGAMDVLMDAYEFVDRIVPIKEMRHCITHANFPSQHNLERCKRLGVCADVQPAWLYKDGTTLAKVLGPERIRWFQPYKSWLEYTTVGGGSDHMIKLDSLASTNPWNPWLGLWVSLTRNTERGMIVSPEEALSREQALRMYTINNAYLHHEEKEKGSLEVGKLGDLILIDRDYMTCPVNEVRDIQVLATVVGGRVVYERKK